jgi:hypothetical protein
VQAGETREATNLPEVERGNEALPSAPSAEHRFEEQPQERMERSAAPVNIVNDQPVAAPVQAPATESAVVQVEPRPVVTEPKNP